MQDRARALQDIGVFLRRVSYRHPEFGCVYVIEYQKRGAIHFHVIYNGLYRAEELREIWYGVVGVEQGSVNLKFYPKGRGNRYTKLAGYISKYVGKDLDEGREAGQHRYFRFHVPEHVTEKYYLPDDHPRIMNSVTYETQLFLDIRDSYYPEEKGRVSLWSFKVEYGGWYAAIEKETRQ
jgi:hypothetical protein